MHDHMQVMGRSIDVVTALSILKNRRFRIAWNLHGFRCASFTLEFRAHSQRTFSQHATDLYPTCCVDPDSWRSCDCNAGPSIDLRRNSGSAARDGRVQPETSVWWRELYARHDSARADRHRS